MERNGKPLGTVRSEVESIPPSSVRVRFVMNEGAKVRIGEIKFTGNKVFKDDALKASLKLTKERGLITMFKGTDKYHQGKLEADIEMNLKAYFKEHGYMQVQVGEPITRIFEGERGMIPMFRKTKQQFYVEIPIDAGDQYRIGELTLKECGVLKCEALVKAFGLNKGDVVNYKKIKDTMEQFKKLYGNMGYINWSYVPEQNFDPKNKTIDLTFTLNPDKQFTVHRIDFAGNTKTRDKVMRRELLLEEGKIFSSAALEYSVQRLNQLGFFDKIEEKDYQVQPDDKTSQVDVNIKVKEKSQQSIGLTGGVSGISGSFLGVNYTTNNFLGRGESLEFSITGGTRATDFVISFNEPYLFDSRWGMGLSLYKQKYRYDTYSVYGVTSYDTGKPTELFTRKTTGSTVSVSRPLGRTWWRFGGSYTYQKIGIEDIAKGFEAFALGQLVGYAPGTDVEAALSGFRKSEVTPMLSFNSTNSYFNPTRGSSMNLSVAIAGGILGGDFNIIRPAVEFRHFRPDRLFSKGRHTWGMRILAEHIMAYGNSFIPFYDRFFIGGETTIRGFDIRSISPLAISSTPLLDPFKNPIIDLNTGLAKINRGIISVGGDTMVIFNGEYRIPIAGPLSMSAFYDVGITQVTRPTTLGSLGASSVKIWDASNGAIHGSTGVEVQFLLPVVSAPFRLIFAYNPQRYNGTVMVGNVPVTIHEPAHDIKFTIGRSF